MPIVPTLANYYKPDFAKSLILKGTTKQNVVAFLFVVAETRILEPLLQKLHFFTIFSKLYRRFSGSTLVTAKLRNLLFLLYIIIFILV